MRRATSMICQMSLMQSPGGFTNCSQCWVRRSELPNMPSRSIHMAEGKIISEGIKAGEQVITSPYTNYLDMNRLDLKGKDKT